MKIRILLASPIGVEGAPGAERCLDWISDTHEAGLAGLAERSHTTHMRLEQGDAAEQPEMVGEAHRATYETRSFPQNLAMCSGCRNLPSIDASIDLVVGLCGQDERPQTRPDREPGRS